jgi:cbb3-type cytochrome c oxidase subunit III
MFATLGFVLLVINLTLVFQLSERGRLAAAAEAARAGQARRGAGLFATNCSMCHGAAGQGTDRAPQLNDPAFLAGVTDDFLRDTIAEGRPRTEMAAWGQDYGGSLTTQQIDQVVAFVRAWEHPVEAAGRTTTLGGLPADSVDGGRETWLYVCSGCHGENGDVPVGAQNIVASAPERLRLQSDLSLRARIENGGAEMPGFESALSAAEVDGLIKYLNSWPR